MKLTRDEISVRRSRSRTSARRLLLAATVLSATPLLAQTANPTDDLSRRLEQIQRETRLLASPDLSTTDRAIIDYGAYLTLSYFSTNTSANDNVALRQYDLNAFARLNFDGAHEFYFRNRLQYRDYNPGDQTPTDDDGLQNYVEEAYYRFNLARYLAAYKGQPSTDNLVITAGRQFEQWSTGLVLNQYLDGIKAEANIGPVGAEILAGVTPYGTTDFDTSRPNYDKSTYRGYFGGLTSLQLGQHKPFVYGLVQRDYNQDRDLVLGPNSTVEYEYNSYYIGAGSVGNLTDNLQYSLEGVYEGGETKSGPTQDFDPTNPATFQDTQLIQAWAGLASLEYLFNDPRRSRVGSMFIIASGDPDRQTTNSTAAGSRAGTNDHAFNGLGLVATGYAFNPPISNLMVLKFNASTFPFGQNGGILSRLQLGTDLLFYGKTRRNAPLDETTSSDTYLGTEIGPYLNWRVVEDVTFQVRYGIFFPGSAIQAPEGSSIDPDKIRQFLYTSITYSF